MLHAFDEPCYMKNEKYIKKTWLQSRFSCISHFSCSRTHRKYATWVLLGWGIRFCIQWLLPLEIWVKNLGGKLKIRVEKIVFFIFSSKTWWSNLILFYYFHYYFIILLRRPILDLTNSLMKLHHVKLSPTTYFDPRH